MVVAHILWFFNFEDGCFRLKALILLFDVMGKLSLLQLLLPSYAQSLWSWQNEWVYHRFSQDVMCGVNGTMGSETTDCHQ